MRYRLRANLHHCIFGNRVIFLDADSGRYSCLGPQSDRALQRLIANDFFATDDVPDLEPLVRSGILVVLEGEDEPPSASIPLPLSDLGSEWYSRAAISTVAMTVVAQLCSRSALRRRSLTKIRERTALSRRECGEIGEPRSMAIATEAAAAFARTELLFPRTDRCLPRSLAFLGVCGRKGFFPSIVFGVRTNPFTAHCWAQYGTIVLNDQIDRVRLFTPIFAL
ncbi:MAG: hypothetical protein JWR80_5976 [Bradyrhizobium sp.]|nr:hypothetical protein [Bradyrhizobium sp.]